MQVEIVKQLREKLGLAQEDISRALGLADRGAVSRWERGDRVPSEPILRLFRYLHSLPKAEALTVLKKFKQYGSDKYSGGKK